MNREKVNEFIAYLDNQITACKEHEEEMKSDNRMDERIFEKIRGNVYNICKTIFTVAGQNTGEDISQEQFFINKLEQISGSWQEAYDKAKAHDDAEKMQTEGIKLDVAEDIRKHFLIFNENDL